MEHFSQPVCVHSQLNGCQPQATDAISSIMEGRAEEIELPSKYKVGSKISIVCYPQYYCDKWPRGTQFCKHSAISCSSMLPAHLEQANQGLGS